MKKRGEMVDVMDDVLGLFVVGMLLLYVIYVFAVMFGCGLNQLRGIDSRIERYIVERLGQDLPSLSKDELDYIAEKTSSCVEKPSSISGLQDAAMLGFFGVSQEKLDSSFSDQAPACLKKYVLSADTVSEMKIRNAQLGHLAPYSVAELAVIASARENNT